MIYYNYFTDPNPWNEANLFNPFNTKNKHDFRYIGKSFYFYLVFEYKILILILFYNSNQFAIKYISTYKIWGLLKLVIV